MKFDPKKPHGVVMNHPWIRYEQGGRQFDFNGQPTGSTQEDIPHEEQPEVVKLSEVPFVPPVYSNNEIDGEVESAKEFLTNILKEGPIRRSEVFRLCEQQNHQWQKVKEAFQELEGQMFKRGPSLYWQLRRM